MTSEDTDKLVTVTYKALRSEFGLLGDLPFELANTVANVYFRYFQQAMDSAPAISMEESVTRQSEFESIPGVIATFRQLRPTEVHQSVIDMAADITLDFYKYRIPNALTKIPIRRMIERKFRRTQDIPNLVTILQLYQ